MTEVTELTEVTKELMIELDKLKEDIKNSMIRGEVNILKGIIIFEAVLKEINPLSINDEETARIEAIVRNYLRNKEELMQHVNAYVHYGVNRCLLILYSYNKLKNIDKKELIKK